MRNRIIRKVGSLMLTAAGRLWQMVQKSIIPESVGHVNRMSTIACAILQNMFKRPPSPPSSHPTLCNEYDNFSENRPAR